MANVAIPEWTLADHLRKARQTTGLNQREFAERLGVKYTAYAQWEADNNRPRDVVLVAKRVEMLTGIPASWTLGVDEPIIAPHGNAPSDAARGAITVNLELPQQSRLAVVNADGAVDPEATERLDQFSELKSSTLRLTAGCSAELSYRGLRGGSLRVRRGAGATGCHLLVAA